MILSKSYQTSGAPTEVMELTEEEKKRWSELKQKLKQT